MSISWEPSFSEDQLKEYVEAQKEEDRKVIDGLETGLAQADDRIGKLTKRLMDANGKNAVYILKLKEWQRWMNKHPISNCKESWEEWDIWLSKRPKLIYELEDLI